MSKEEEIIVLSESFAKLISGNTEFAGMANPKPKLTPETNSEDPLCLVCDCGATSTLTNSMINCTDVEERVVSIQTAQDGATMKSSHVCMKTYFTLSRAGEIVAISTRSYYVKSLQCDLLAGRALTRAGYRVVLDEDTDISGIHPLDKNGEPQLQKCESEI